MSDDAIGKTPADAGLPEIMRELPGLARSLGLAGALAISAVATGLLIRHWDDISGLDGTVNDGR